MTEVGLAEEPTEKESRLKTKAKNKKGNQQAKETS